jgi:hypothetical protein
LKITEALGLTNKEVKVGTKYTLVPGIIHLPGIQHSNSKNNDKLKQTNKQTAT